VLKQRIFQVRRRANRWEARRALTLPVAASTMGGSLRFAAVVRDNTGVSAR
jgi:hypothetical protein